VSRSEEARSNLRALIIILTGGPVVGNLIRHLKSDARVAKDDDAAVASQEPTVGLSMPDAVNLPFTARNGTTRAFARTMAKSLRLGSGIDYSHLA
jgi:hypothetical protein